MHNQYHQRLRIQVTEKQETIVALNTEITSITINIDTLKAALKEKNAKKDMELLEAKKAGAESVLKKLLFLLLLNSESDAQL